MWAVLKKKKKNLELLKKDLCDKLGNDVKFYTPKLRLKKFLKKKIYTRESFLLGDYLLCFHSSFCNSNIIEILKYCKGVKYSNFFSSEIIGIPPIQQEKPLSFKF